MKIRLFILFFICLSSTFIAAENQQTQEGNQTKTTQQELSVMFTPPAGWRFANEKQLPSSVKVMVIGKGSYDYPPSMNLGTEPFNGSLKEYLKIIKAINSLQGAEWKDLGQIRTQAGNASLSQVDMQTEWGNVRLMHAIIVRSGAAYVLTAAALKDEFPQFYKDFFTSLCSLQIAEKEKHTP